MSMELSNQRRKEKLHEVRLHRLKMALKAPPRDPPRIATVEWELVRIIGLLHKYFGLPKDVD